MAALFRLIDRVLQRLRNGGEIETPDFQIQVKADPPKPVIDPVGVGIVRYPGQTGDADAIGRFHLPLVLYDAFFLPLPFAKGDDRVYLIRAEAVLPDRKGLRGPDDPILFIHFWIAPPRRFVLRSRVWQACPAVATHRSPKRSALGTKRT